MEGRIDQLPERVRLDTDCFFGEDGSYYDGPTRGALHEGIPYRREREGWAYIPWADVHVSRDGMVRTQSGREYEGSSHTKGYRQVDTAKGTKYVHRLVAQAFLEVRGTEVDHINGDRSDNRVENLRWVTRSENMKYANDRYKRKHGRNITSNHNQARGSRVHGSKLTPDDVRTIRFMLASGYTQPSIAKAFGVSLGQIEKIRSGQCWDWLDKPSGTIKVEEQR